MGRYLQLLDWGEAVARSSPKAQAILHQSDAPGGAILPQAIIDHLHQFKGHVSTSSSAI